MAPDISNGLNGHPATDDSNAELWRHPDPTSTQMHAFKERVNAKYGLKLDHYEDLHKWSVEHIGDFWGEVWDFTGIKGNRVDEPVSDNCFMSRGFVFMLSFSSYQGS